MKQAHYDKFPSPVIDLITDCGLDFIRGNIIKYVCRFPYKDGAADIRKAQHYADMLHARDSQAAAETHWIEWRPGKDAKRLADVSTRVEQFIYANRFHLGLLQAQAIRAAVGLPSLATLPIAIADLMAFYPDVADPATVQESHGSYKGGGALIRDGEAALSSTATAKINRQARRVESELANSASARSAMADQSIKLAASLKAALEAQVGAPLTPRAEPIGEWARASA